VHEASNVILLGRLVSAKLHLAVLLPKRRFNPAGAYFMTAPIWSPIWDGLREEGSTAGCGFISLQRCSLLMKWGTCPWMNSSDDLLSTRQRPLERGSIILTSNKSMASGFHLGDRTSPIPAMIAMRIEDRYVRDVSDHRRWNPLAITFVGKSE